MIEEVVVRSAAGWRDLRLSAVDRTTSVAGLVQTARRTTSVAGGSDSNAGVSLLLASSITCGTLVSATNKFIKLACVSIGARRGAE